MRYDFNEEEVVEREREMEELRENATYAMVRAARDLRAVPLSPEEHVAIERLLAVFDLPPPIKEEPDINF